MNKLKRDSMLEKINNGELDEVKKAFDISFIKKSLISIVTLIILIISFINNDRILLFTHMFGSFLLDFDLLAISLYYSSLMLVLGYNICFMIIMLIKKNDSYSFLLKFDSVLDMPYFIFKTISILFFIFIFMLSPCSIVGDSMNPTLKNNERVICYGLFYTPEKDDIVVLNAKNYHEGQDVFYVKRVVATENDFINYDYVENKFYVNDVYVETINFAQYRTMLKSINLEFQNSFIVPNDKAIVLGDNRNNSLDSRQFGLVDYDDIFGKILLRLSPFDIF